MNTTLAICGALGGIAVFTGAVWAVIRAITHQITATESNTAATAAATAAVKELEDKVDTLDRSVFQNGEKLAAHAAAIAALKNAITRRPGR